MYRVRRLFNYIHAALRGAITWREAWEEIQWILVLLAHRCVRPMR